MDPIAPARQALLEDLLDVGETYGPWMIAADLGAPPGASLRHIAFLYSSKWAEIPAMQCGIDVAVESLLYGFARYLVIAGEANRIDFK